MKTPFFFGAFGAIFAIFPEPAAGDCNIFWACSARCDFACEKPSEVVKGGENCGYGLAVAMIVPTMTPCTSFAYAVLR